MSKSPSPKLDQLRAMREEGFISSKTSSAPAKSPTPAERKQATAAGAARTSAKAARKKSIPIEKLDASNDG